MAGQWRTGRVGELMAALALEQIGVETEIINRGCADLLAFSELGLLRVQVKSCQYPRLSTPRSTQAQYDFSATKGVKAKIKLTSDDCDVVSFVAVDLGKVLFRATAEIGVGRVRINPQEMLSPCLEKETWEKAIEEIRCQQASVYQ